MAFSRSSLFMGLGDDGAESNGQQSNSNNRSFNKGLDENSSKVLNNSLLNNEDCLTLDFGPFER